MKHTCLKHLNTLFKKLQQQLDFLSRNPCKLDYKLWSQHLHMPEIWVSTFY